MSDYVPIHGKQYKTVAARVRDFRETHGLGWGIHTTPIKSLCDADTAVVRCVITSPDGKEVGSGLAREVRTDPRSKVNSTSFLENCETSAIGRALASMGYSGSDEYASADEVGNAILQQVELESKARSYAVLQQLLHCLTPLEFKEWFEVLDESEQVFYFSCGPKGSKVALKKEVNEKIAHGNEEIDAYAVELERAAGNRDSIGVSQLVDEISVYTNGKASVWARLDAPTKETIKALLKEQEAEGGIDG